MKTTTTKSAVLIEAGRRTAKTVVRSAQRWVKRVEAIADRHPGIAAGGSVGYLLGRQVEWVPGVPKRLPRYMGAVVGASVGYVFEKAYREVMAEQRLVQKVVGGAAHGSSM